MSEQIREQVSAFLDGELPNSEAELLLKRLTRDPELRESFGRYALIGESLRGGSHARLSQGFQGRVNRAIDGDPAAPPVERRGPRLHRWWRPFAGAAVAAGVAAVGVLALQQRAPVTAQNAAGAPPREALSYTVPAAVSAAPGAAAPGAAAPAAMPAARLTHYVFAHSKYSSVLGQSNVLSGLLTDSAGEDAGAANPAGVPEGGAVSDAVLQQSRDARVAP